VFNKKRPEVKVGCKDKTRDTWCQEGALCVRVAWLWGEKQKQTPWGEKKGCNGQELGGTVGLGGAGGKKTINAVVKSNIKENTGVSCTFFKPSQATYGDARKRRRTHTWVREIEPAGPESFRMPPRKKRKEPAPGVGGEA